MDDISLTPELARFAAEAVAAGRYRDISEMVQTGLSLLQQAENEAAEFVASLDAALAEGERDGFLTADEVAGRVRAAIAAAVARNA